VAGHHQIPIDFASYNVVHDLVDAMRTAVKRSRISRDEIVDRMNDLAARYGVCLCSGGKLTLDTLDKWLVIDDSSRMVSVKALTIFCKVVDDVAPLDVIARPLGAMVIGQEDINLLKWARAYRKAQQAKADVRRLEKDLC
jgi:hypothetical protein